MSDKNEKVIHPVTIAIVNVMLNASQHLQNLEAVKALEAMYTVLGFMDEKDRVKPVNRTGKPLAESVPHMITRLRAHASRSKLNADTQRYRSVFWEWWTAINQALHDGGYYSGEKFTEFHYPGAQKRDE